jgi:hypothetical protein
MSEFALPAFGSKPWVDALVTYTNFFLSRYVSQDIAMLCGSVFDTPGFKTLTLFGIMYGATRNIRLATIFTVVLLILNLFMANNKQCHPYRSLNSN